MIRLSALQTVGREIRSWCTTTLPLLVAFRLCISKEIHYLALFWMGWRTLYARSEARCRDSGNSVQLSDLMSISKQQQQQQQTQTIQSSDAALKKSKRTAKNLRTRPHQKSLLFPADLQPSDTLDSTSFKAQSSFLFPIDLWVQHICCYLHPKDLTNLACVNKSAQYWADHNDVWKYLWKRDYGRALLQWKIGRQVLQRSLRSAPSTGTVALGESTGSSSSSSSSQNNDGDCDDADDGSLEARLSEWLDCRKTNHENATTSNKRFYFVFGEVYMNYLTAGCNHNMTSSATPNNSDQHDDDDRACLVAMHGHIFDFGAFAQYHPGLVEPILLQCGQDATNYFENIPHSRVARDLARRLCIVANVSCIGPTDGDSTHHHGLLYLLRDSQKNCVSNDQNLARDLKQSNTRPPRLKQPNYLLPDRALNTTRRPPTLIVIREECDQAVSAETKRLQNKSLSSSLLQLLPNPLGVFGNQETGTSPVWRIYYDPFQECWKKWDANLAWSQK